MSLNRRNFLATSAAAAGVAMAGSPRAFAAKSKSDIRVAVIGINSRGRGHISSLGNNVVALCDCDESVLARVADETEQKLGRKVERVVDYRKLLDRGDIDAVSIATPNHTHSLIAITAMQAGKDVYVEKPVSHNVWEGRQLVACAKQTGKVIQCGTQSRSASCLQEAVKWVQEGGLGKIQYAVGTCFKARKSIGQLDKPLELPSSVDYDLWCGPAAKVDLYRPKLHYDWHWDFNTGSGDMGNQGIHQMDIARWFLGEASVAPRSLGVGGRLGYDDAGNTYNTQVVIHEYPTAPLIFETRGLPKSKAAQKDWGRSMDRYRGSRTGVIVQCENGHVYAPSSYRDVWAYDNDGNEIKHWRGGGNHHGNWMSAVEAQDSSKLNAPIREGHVSSALCHLGNLSNTLGEPRRASEIAEMVASNELFADSYGRMVEHLKANEVDVESRPAIVMGSWIDVNPATEVVSGQGADSPLAKRTGRIGFEVPSFELI